MVRSAVMRLKDRYRSLFSQVALSKAVPVSPGEEGSGTVPRRTCLFVKVGGVVKTRMNAWIEKERK